MKNHRNWWTQWDRNGNTLKNVNNLGQMQCEVGCRESEISLFLGHQKQILVRWHLDLGAFWLGLWMRSRWFWDHCCFWVSGSWPLSCWFGPGAWRPSAGAHGVGSWHSSFDAYSLAEKHAVYCTGCAHVWNANRRKSKIIFTHPWKLWQCAGAFGAGHRHTSFENKWQPLKNH